MWRFLFGRMYDWNFCFKGPYRATRVYKFIVNRKKDRNNLINDWEYQVHLYLKTWHSAKRNIIDQYFATAVHKPRRYFTLILTSARWALDLETTAEIDGRRNPRRGSPVDKRASSLLYKIQLFANLPFYIAKPSDPIM